MRCRIKLLQYQLYNAQVYFLWRTRIVTSDSKLIAMHYFFAFQSSRLKLVAMLPHLVRSHQELFAIKLLYGNVQPITSVEIIAPNQPHNIFARRNHAHTYCQHPELLFTFQSVAFGFTPACTCKPPQIFQCTRRRCDYSARCHVKQRQ